MLALSAGLTNVVGYLGFEHQALTHLTGIVSLFAMAASTTQAHHVAVLLGVIGCFFLGALVAGAWSALRPSHTRAILGLVALVLVGSALFFAQGMSAWAWLAAAACGLQNGLTSVDRQFGIRSTHLTGALTDIGTQLARSITGPSSHLRLLHLRLIHQSSGIVLCFLLAGVLGALPFPTLSYYALCLAASIVLLACGVIGPGQAEGKEVS